MTLMPIRRAASISSDTARMALLSLVFCTRKGEHQHGQHRDQQGVPIDPGKIARINELAKKSKTTGLTEGRKAEQQVLRREYIDDMKASPAHPAINVHSEPDGTIPE